MMLGGPGRVGVAVAAIAAALIACGGAIATIPLSQRVLRQSDVPVLIELGYGTTATTATKAVSWLDPEFLPNAARRLYVRQGFRGGIKQHLWGGGRWKGVDGYDEAVQFRSATGAAAVAAFFHRRSLAFCPTACDLQIKDMAVPGIPGALGAHRYRLTKTRNGPAFDYYYVAFTAGTWAYGLLFVGPSGTVTSAQVISAAQALYHRATE